MGFRNPITSFALMIETDLQSDNFVAGVSGWRLQRDTGSAEFQDMTLRGRFISAYAGDRIEISSDQVEFFNDAIRIGRLRANPALVVLESENGAGLTVSADTNLALVGNVTTVFGSTEVRIDTATSLEPFKVNCYLRLGLPGTAASPSMSFDGDEDTGIYRVAADWLGIATGGTLRFDITGTRVLTTVPYRGQNGSAAAPAYSFSSDTDTGIYRVGTNRLGISTGGILRFDINSTRVQTTVPYRGQNGSAAAPAYSFSGDINTGVYGAGANILGLATGGNLRAYVDTTKLALADGIDLQLGSEPWTIDGSGSDDFSIFDGATLRFRIRDDDNNYLLELADTAGTPRHRFAYVSSWSRWHAEGGSGGANYIGINDDGNQVQMIVNNVQEFLLGATSLIVPNVYNLTTAQAATVFVTSNGTLQRSTSSLRYKRKIRPWADHGSSPSVLDLVPSSFQGGEFFKGERRKWHDQIQLGLIAEDVADKFPIAAVRDDQHRPDAIDWNAIVAGLLYEVQDLRDRLVTVESG